MTVRWLMTLIIAVTVLDLAACAGAGAPTEKAAPLEAVRLIPHPTTLEGKTVLLRWNGKTNGDKFLLRIGELLVQRIKDIQVIRLWERDPGTAVISKSADESAALAAKIAALKPDLVIASQAD